MKSRTITKQDLALKVAREVSIHTYDVKKVIDSFVKFLYEALFNGDRIEIRGFGSFKTVSSNRKTAFDFYRKKRIEVSGRKRIVFKVPKELREKLKRGGKNEKSI